MLEEFCNWLQGTSLGLLVSEQYFPAIESVHVIALALVFGSITLVDLRLLGLAQQRLSISYLSSQVIPWTWRAFILAAITGTLMFIGNASTYYGNIPFRIKMVLLVLVAVNMAIFQLSTFRNVAAWDTGRPATSAKVAGGISLVLWVGIIATGRWIGFV
jgi:hypothetical protein